MEEISFFKMLEAREKDSMAGTAIALQVTPRVVIGVPTFRDQNDSSALATALHSAGEIAPKLFMKFCRRSTEHTRTLFHWLKPLLGNHTCLPYFSGPSAIGSAPLGYVDKGSRRFPIVQVH